MKPMSLSEQITYSTVLIQCKYKDDTIGIGIGFIINLCKNEKEQTYIPALITNSHVVENSTQTVFEFCKSDDHKNPIDTESLCITYNANKWIHHPDKEVDLQCLPIGPILDEIKKENKKAFYIALNTNIIPNNEILNDLMGIEDVIMVGYPKGLSDTYNHKPVIRKGITATHPRNNYQGKKETLLDISCYPGSSGSPVFILNEGAYSTKTGVTIGAPRIYLLGILYKGPLFDAQGVLTFSELPNIPTPTVSIPMNLGVMIKAERILEFEKLLSQEANYGKDENGNI